MTLLSLKDSSIEDLSLTNRRVSIFEKNYILSISTSKRLKQWLIIVLPVISWATSLGSGDCFSGKKNSLSSFVWNELTTLSCLNAKNLLFDLLKRSGVKFACFKFLKLLYFESNETLLMDKLTILKWFKPSCLLVLELGAFLDAQYCRL